MTDGALSVDSVISQKKKGPAILSRIDKSDFRCLSAFLFFENQSTGMTHWAVTQYKHNAFGNLKVTEKIFTLSRILFAFGFAHF